MHVPGTRAKMSSIFAYQSSEVDWCESNFQHSELVAEFYNTIPYDPENYLGTSVHDDVYPIKDAKKILSQFSNVFFLIFGPLMMFLMHPYAQKRTRCFYGVSVLFMLIGLFSMYFHMTLSFLGQLLDEISILWLLASGYSVWLPRCYFPKFVKGNRFYFSCLVTITTIISTFLTFVKPTVNAYALNSIAIHILYIVRTEYKKIRDDDLRHLIAVSVVLWAAALTSWISDRVLCSFWQRIHFYYLHSIWHVLISITFPYGIVTMALVDAKYEMPDKTLKVHYWPRDSWVIGLPYVEIQENDKNC